MFHSKSKPQPKNVKPIFFFLALISLSTLFVLQTAHSVKTQFRAYSLERSTEVLITEQGFIPNSVTIAPGELVVWRNETTRTVEIGSTLRCRQYVPLIHKASTVQNHSVDNQPSLRRSNYLDDDWFSSGLIAPGGIFSRPFEVEGRYAYFLGCNSDITGSILVQSLPTPTPTSCPPTIEFTHIPPYNSFENLEGQIACVTPADYRVAVYIYVPGWWTKPTFANPLTPIRVDGSWMTDITTGGIDHLATQIAAFLVPVGYNPPLMSGGQTLPKELFENAVDYLIVDRDPVFRTLEFSGYTWNVKASESPIGPGPNYFSNREEDVWVDENGHLHLTITFQNNRWYNTEIINTESLGYGTYMFKLASRVDQLDKNAVLGLFTWDNFASESHYREIDIEFSRWRDELAPNAQYVVQPWGTPGNRHRFDMELLGDLSMHLFEWNVDSLHFASYQGHQTPPDPGNEIESWVYTGGDIPSPGLENVRLNLWLVNGIPPSDGQEIEVVIEAFEFVSHME